MNMPDSTAPRYVTSRCQYCDGHIEFDAASATVGQTVTCPHCGLETTLFVPPPPQTSPVVKKGQSRITILSVALGVCVLLILGLTGLLVADNANNRPKVNSDITATKLNVQQPQTAISAATQELAVAPNPKTEEEQIDALKAKPLLMTSEEKAARNNILKGLLDVSSSVSVGVTRDRYGALLIKALSTFTYEKTKLSTTRHQKFLLCAAKALNYYAKANDEWSDYFKYDWMRDKDEALMSQADFEDLRQNGITVNVSSYRHVESDKTFFYVPFNESLSLYWKAADIYVEKMKSDVE